VVKISRSRIILALVLLTAVFVPPFVKYQELRYKDKKLAEEITSVKKENKILTEQKERLQTDINYMEQKARKIGFVRKGEIVIKPSRKQ
jgi:cell division protein FtsB